MAATPPPQPPPQQQQQLNFNNLHQHILAVAAEVQHFGNMPGAPAAAGAIVQIQDVLQHIVNQLVGVNARLDRIQASIDRIPMQLHNATASIHAELHVPEGVDVPFALSKMVLITLPAAACNEVVAALDLPALPQGALVSARRQVIMDYLGCGMRAVQG